MPEAPMPEAPMPEPPMLAMREEPSAPEPAAEPAANPWLAHFNRWWTHYYSPPGDNPSNGRRLLRAL